MLDRTATKTFSGVALCSDVEQFVAVMFGAPQQDDHMRRWRSSNIRKANQAAFAQMDADIAAAGSVTAWLRNK